MKELNPTAADLLQADGCPDACNRLIPSENKEPSNMPTRATQSATAPARPPAIPSESNMRKSAKKATAKTPPARKVKTQPAVKAKKAARSARGTAKPSAAAKPLRPGSKLEAIVKLLRKPGGCTTQELLVATGWKTVSVALAAKNAGVALNREKRDGTTYYSSPGA